MTILTIRAHKRHAVREPVWLKKSNGFEVTGLLVDVSSAGCRINHLGGDEFAEGDAAVVELNKLSLVRSIRWLRQGVAGVRLQKQLDHEQLASIVHRGNGTGNVRQYGT
jgi:hypothetical protein